MGTTARKQVEVRKRLNLMALRVGRRFSLPDDDLGRLVALHTTGAADPVHEVVLLRRMAPQVIKRLERVMEPGHADKQAYWRKWSNLVHGHEKALTPKLQDFFHEQGVRVAAAYGHSAIVATRMRAEGDDPPPLDWFDTEGWNAQLGGLLADGMKPAMEDAGMAVSASLGGEPFDSNAQGVRDYIENRSTDVAGMVNGTTEDQLRSIVADGAVNGLGIDDIARSISGYFDDRGRGRAEVIARTEVLGASNAASLEAARQSGAIAGKQWLTSADDRVCPDCEAMDGEQVGIDELFSSGDDAPPAHPDCRCTLLMLTADEFAPSPADASPVTEAQLSFADDPADVRREIADILEARVRAGQDVAGLHEMARATQEGEVLVTARSPKGGLVGAMSYSQAVDRDAIKLKWLGTTKDEYHAGTVLLDHAKSLGKELRIDWSSQEGRPWYEARGFKNEGGTLVWRPDGVLSEMEKLKLQLAAGKVEILVEPKLDLSHPDVVAGVKAWTGGQRSVKEDLAEIRKDPKYDTFFKAIADAPPVAPELYRGIVFHSQEDVDLWTGLKKGDVIPIDKAASFSTRKEWSLHQFTYDSGKEGVLVVMEPGARALNVESVSNTPGEKEWLAAHGLEVVSTEVKTTFDAEEGYEQKFVTLHVRQVVT